MVDKGREKTLLKFTLLLLVFLTFGTFIAQHVKQGDISQNKAYYLTFDKDGYVWIGDKPGSKVNPYYNSRGEQMRIGE